MSALDSTIAAAGSTRLDSLLTRSAQRTPHAVALRFEAREWSYAELEDAVDRVAVRLLGASLNGGDRVAAYGLNSDAYAVLFLACARAGLVHVPVNFALKGDELRYLLEDSGASLLAVDPVLRATAEAVQDAGGAASVRQVWDLLPPPGGETRPSVLTTALDAQVHGDAEALAAVSVGGDDLVQLLYTSGTTSAPKGAMMTHSALVAEYVSATLALDLDVEDRPLVAMPLYHSAAMHVFLMPYLALGATVRLLAKPDVGQILALVEAEYARSLFLAPTVWVPLANHP